MSASDSMVKKLINEATGKGPKPPANILALAKSHEGTFSQDGYDWWQFTFSSEGLANSFSEALKKFVNWRGISSKGKVVSVDYDEVR